MPILTREGLARFRSAEWSESAFPHLRSRVRLATAAYEFRDARMRPELAALAWIPVRDVGDIASSATDMRFSFILATPPLTAIRRDTTVAVSDARGGVVRGIAMLPVTERGASTLRVIALDPADTTRGGVRAVPLRVRGDTGARGISDIVLAVPDVPGLLRRGTHAVAPLPGHTITTGASFRLFAEVYGAEDGEEAAVTVRIRRVDASALAQLRRLFPGREAERTLSFARRVDLDERGVMVEDIIVGGDLIPGDYTIELTVVLELGETVVRETALHVAAPA